MEQLQEFEKLLNQKILWDGEYDKITISKEGYELSGVILIDCWKDLGSGLEPIKSFYLENLLFGRSGFMESFKRADQFFSDRITVNYHKSHLAILETDEQRINYILKNIVNEKTNHTINSNNPTTSMMLKG